MATRIVSDGVWRSCPHYPCRELSARIDQKTFVRHLRKIHGRTPEEIRFDKFFSIIYRPFHEERD